MLNYRTLSPLPSLIHIIRLAFILLCGLLVSPALFAADATNYTTNSFTTQTGNARVIPVDNVLNSSSVTYEPGESAAVSRLLTCPDGTCSVAPYTVTQGGTTIGTVTLDGENLVFTPTNPNFIGTVAIPYRVEVPTGTSSGIANIIINITGDVTLGANYLAFMRAFNQYCDSNDNSALVLARCQEYRSLTGVAQTTALAQISPEEISAQAAIVVDSTRQQQQNIANRLNELRGGSRAVSIAGLRYRSHQDVLTGSHLQQALDSVGGNAGDEDFPPFSVFLNGTLTDTEKDPTGASGKYSGDADNITFGGDYRFNTEWIAGVAYGMGNNEVTFGPQTSLDDESTNVIAYGSWAKNNFYVDLSTGYSISDLSLERNVAYNTSAAPSLVRGNTESSKWFVSVAGYFDFINGPWILSSFSGLNIIDGSVDGYDELGNTGLEMRYGSQDIRARTFNMGVRAQYTWSLPWGVLSPYARFEWKRELADDATAINAAFVLDPDNRFSLSSDQPDESWYQWGCGASLTLPAGLSAYIDYQESLELANIDSSATSGGVRWEVVF